jgi:hypothetical protein
MYVGKNYQFTYYATNIDGNSELANVLSVPVADLPGTPSAPVMQSHSEVAITVSWAEVADPSESAGQIQGYNLYMDNGKHEDFELVFSGLSSPDIRTYTAEGLTAGLPYKFYVEAFNVIGVSAPSEILTVYACADPSDIEPPFLSG